MPAELTGRYLRNGPNPLGLDDPHYHWFLGAGMVHGVRLRDGRAEWYRNRWVRSKAVAAQHDEKWPAGPVHENMDFAANTHIISHGGRTLATVEAGPLPYELTDELDTVGPCDFGGTLPGGFAAHTKLDHATGELHAIAYFWAWDHVQHVIVDPGGKVTRTTDIPVTDGPMMHDFALTANYVVLMDLPVTFSLSAVTAGKELPYVWNPGHQARVGLLRRDGSSDVRWIEIEPCWVFHCLNAYEDSRGQVLVDLCQYNDSFDVSTLWAAHGPVTLDRWTIDPAAGKVIQQRLDDRGQEFPRVDDRIISRPHRYGYSAVIGEVNRAITATGDFADAAFTNAILKHDLAAAPCRGTSSAATPPRARPCSLPPRRTPPRTTATSWPSCTTPTAALPTWSSSPPRTSPANRSPGSTCPPASRSASTAAGSPTTNFARHSLACAPGARAKSVERPRPYVLPSPHVWSMISAQPRVGARRRAPGRRTLSMPLRRTRGSSSTGEVPMEALQQIGLRHPRIRQIRHIASSNGHGYRQLLLAEGLWAHGVLVDLDAAIEVFLWCPEAAYSPEAHALSAQVTARARCAYRISPRVLDRLCERERPEGLVSLVALPAWDAGRIELASRGPGAGR